MQTHAPIAGLLGAFLGLLIAAPMPLAAERNDARPYSIRAVRIDPSGAIIYRLDTATGTVCAIAYGTPNTAGTDRGCVDGPGGDVRGRFRLDAVAGARGTVQSSGDGLGLSLPAHRQGATRVARMLRFATARGPYAVMQARSIR